MFQNPKFDRYFAHFDESRIVENYPFPFFSSSRQKIKTSQLLSILAVCFETLKNSKITESQLRLKCLSIFKYGGKFFNAGYILADI